MDSSKNEAYPHCIHALGIERDLAFRHEPVLNFRVGWRQVQEPLDWVQADRATPDHLGQVRGEAARSAPEIQDESLVTPQSGTEQRIEFSSLKLGHPWDLVLGMPEIQYGSRAEAPGSVLPLLDLRLGAEETMGYSKSETPQLCENHGPSRSQATLAYPERAQR